MKLVTFILLCFSILGFSEMVRDLQILGDCTKRNTDFIENGNSFSVIFRELDVKMPKGEVGDGLRYSKICDLKLNVLNPPGRYLAVMRQVVVGGVLKSARAQGELTIRNNMAGMDFSPRGIQWAFGQGIAPTSPEANFIRESQIRFPKSVGCKSSLPLQTRLILRANRLDVANDYFLGAVDSLDAEGISRIQMFLNFQSCN